MDDASGVEEARRFAALASGGYSHDVIYKAALSNFSGRAQGRILDYGAGVGHFTALLSKVFPEARVMGADIMERPAGAPAAVDWVQGDLNADLPLEPGLFDAIFSLEVIEHLENPRHMFREIHRLLRPGGVAVVTTPNIRSLRSLVSFALKGCFGQFDDTNYPAHITPISPLDMERAAQEAGLTRTRSFFTDLGKMPRLVTRNWQELPLLGPSLTGLFFSDTVGMEFAKAAS